MRVQRTSRQRTEYWALLMLMSALSTVVGCGGAEATLHGTVTMDGEPVEAAGDVNGTIYLQPVGGGKASPAVAEIDDDGGYEVRTGSEAGLAAGEYAVTINVVQMIPPKQDGFPAYPKRLSPRRYMSAKSSGLTVTVEPGSNEFDIALESDGSSARG